MLADWWRNDSAPHAVSNLTEPVGQDDSSYLTEAFVYFIERRAAERKPFVAQIAYHNCHVSRTHVLPPGCTAADVLGVGFACSCFGSNVRATE